MPDAVVLYDANFPAAVPLGTTDNPLKVSDVGGGGGGGGDASAANQVTGNASLASIDTKTPVLGQALAAASTPVVLTAAQLATLTPPAAIAGFATGAKQDTGNTSLASLDTKTPGLGQALAAASTPVVLTALQVAALTPPVAITGFATETTLAASLGATNESAAANDNDTKGLNGLIKRLLAKFTTQFPAALGQGTMAQSMRVVLSSDQSSIGVTPAAGELHLGEVGSFGDRLFGEFTRPANVTAYNANDVVSDNITTTTPTLLTNAVRVNAGTGYIVGASLVTNKKSIVPRFRVHLFNANTMTIAADHAQFKEVYADNAIRLGYFDLPAMTTAADTANSDMSRSQNRDTIRHFIKAAAGTRNIYYVLECLDAFTPASGELFRLQLFMELN